MSNTPDFIYFNYMPFIYTDDSRPIQYDYYMTTGFRMNYPIRFSPYNKDKVDWFDVSEKSWSTCTDVYHGNLEYLGHNLSDREVIEKFNKIKVTIELEK